MSINAVRIAYLICDLICAIFTTCVAIATPIWLTPGYYWWTAFAILCLLGQSHIFTKRLNQWDGMGEA